MTSNDNDAVNSEQDKASSPPKILNPLYDPVCKFLLHDTDCARLFLSKLLQQEISSLELLAEEVPLKLDPSAKAQETLASLKAIPPKDQSYTLLRLDFKATIETPEGQKIVLIEIQKIHTSADIPRFRAYLGAQYLNKKYAKVPLIAIYLLGTKLPESLAEPELQVPIIHSRISSADVLRGREIKASAPFIARLTHEVYTIQVPYLSPIPTSDLEKALLIFNPHYVASNPHFLTLEEDDLQGEYAILWKCLAKAAAEPEIEKNMQAFDEYVETFDAYADEIIKYRQQAEAKEQLVAAKEKELLASHELVEVKTRAAEKYQTESQAYQVEVQVYKAENQVYKAENQAYKQRLAQIEQERVKAEQEKAAHEQRIKELEELLQQQKFP